LITGFKLIMSGVAKKEFRKAKKVLTLAEQQRRVAQRVNARARKQVRADLGSNPPRVYPIDSKRLGKTVRRAVPFGQNQSMRKVARSMMEGKTFQSPLVREYCHSLLNPGEIKARIPDASTVKTAVLHTTQVVDVNAYWGGANGGDGRFAIAANPKIGDPNGVDSYATAFCQPQTFQQLAPDWSLPANYVGLNGIGQLDCRIDNVINDVCQPQISAYAIEGTVNSNPLAPFGVAVFPLPSINAVPILNSSYQCLIPYTQKPGVSSDFGIPPGQWNVNIHLTSAGSTLTSGITVVFTANVITSRLLSDPAADADQYSLFISVPNDGTRHTMSISSTGTANDVTASLIMSPCYTPALPSVLSAGKITRVRPVSMSVFATEYSSGLDNGGQIGTCYVCADTYKNQFIACNPSSTIGSLQLFENIARMAKDGRAYDGPIKTGTYCYWVPEGPEDSEWVTPDEMNSREYPSIIVSGIAKLNTPPVNNPSSNFLRVRIERNYEIQTSCSLWETAACVGSQAAIDAAFQQLAYEPRAMANDAHEPFLKRLGAWLAGAAGKVGKFYSANARWINPAIAGALTLL